MNGSEVLSSIAAPCHGPLYMCADFTLPLASTQGKTVGLHMVCMPGMLTSHVLATEVTEQLALHSSSRANVPNDPDFNQGER